MSKPQKPECNLGGLAAVHPLIIIIIIIIIMIIIIIIIIIIISKRRLMKLRIARR